MTIRILELVSVTPKILSRLVDISARDGSSQPVSDHWLQQLCHRGERFFVAEEKGEYIGFISFDPFFKPDKNGIELDVISVLKQFQNKGVGSALLSHVRKEAVALSKKKIYLLVSQKNFNAIQFYSRRGFYPAGLILDRYGKGEHSHYFCLDL